MLKITVFLCLFLLHAKSENLPHLRHGRLSRKYGINGSPWLNIAPLDGSRNQRSTYDADKLLSTKDVFQLLERSEDKEELSTPTYESEMIPYGDDAKSYKVVLPLPQKPKDIQVANLCYVPTRRGMIVTHCGLSDDEGTCPKTKSCGFIIPLVWTHPKLCLSDFDCPSEQKCCPHSCYLHKVCQHPTPEKVETTVNHISITQFINLNVNKEMPENIKSILIAALNTTNADNALRNLTTSNSSDYNLTVSYNHNELSHKPINSSNDNEEVAFSNNTREDSLPFNLTITRNKEYEPNSNFTYNHNELSHTPVNSSNDNEEAYFSNTTHEDLPYNHNELSHTPINSSNDDDEAAFSNNTRVPFNLTIIRNKEYEPNSNFTSTEINNSKEYAPTSNLTFSSSQERHQQNREHLPMPNPFDPDAEFNESYGSSGSGDSDYN